MLNENAVRYSMIRAFFVVHDRIFEKLTSNDIAANSSSSFTGDDELRVPLSDLLKDTNVGDDDDYYNANEDVDDEGVGDGCSL